MYTNHNKIIKDHCLSKVDIIFHNNKYYYEQNQTAEFILHVSKYTFDHKLKFVKMDYKISKDNKIYIEQTIVINNLTETNLLLDPPVDTAEFQLKI